MTSKSCRPPDDAYVRLPTRLATSLVHSWCPEPWISKVSQKLVAELQAKVKSCIQSSGLALKLGSWPKIVKVAADSGGYLAEVRELDLNSKMLAHQLGKLLPAVAGLLVEVGVLVPKLGSWQFCWEGCWR